LHSIRMKHVDLLEVIFFRYVLRQFLPRDATQARPMSSCGVCVSVCVTATFVDHVKTNKHIIRFFSLSGSHTILSFRAKRHSNTPTGPPPTEASNTGWVGKNRDSDPFLLRCLVFRLQQARCCHGRRWTTATVPQQVVTHRW